ncbi:HCP-like protein [Mycena floridula]|nr:HCP-like protein [Mycena floridula]
MRLVVQADQHPSEGGDAHSSKPLPTLPDSLSSSSVSDSGSDHGGWSSPWAPWNQSSPYPAQPLPHPGSSSLSPYVNNLNSSMASLMFSLPQTQHPPRAISAQPPSPPRQNQPLPLTAPIPSIPSLNQVLGTIQQPSHDPALKLAWCRDVLFLVDQSQTAQSHTSGTAITTGILTGPIIIHDPQLLRLCRVAVPMILQIASINQTPMPLYVAEAIFLRATFLASGAHPEHVKINPRTSFRDFETSARSGYHQAWFRLGRDYENFNDLAHAKDCFERGLKLGVESCFYRLGMAHLLGQLNLPASQETALPLLLRAATLASLECPQPAYIYALLLLGEFGPVSIPTQTFNALTLIPPASTSSLEARKHLERSAYLHFAPAQYKLGHAYEFATPSPPFDFDPLLSVEWYSKASQQGEVEADMALSKWFLCGAEGAFDKDENLAWVFAERAAGKGLPSAEFAMGYYCEVGIGGPADVQKAVMWYQKAKEHGNADAVGRLQALAQPQPQALSRQEHNSLTDDKLVRKRTQAKQRSEAARPDNGAGVGAGPRRRGDGRQVIDVIRKNTITSYPEPGQGAGPPRGRYPSHSREHSQSTPVPRPQKAVPAQHRYTLTDAPPQVTPAADSHRTQSPASRNPNARPPNSNLAPPGPNPNSRPNSAPSSNASSNASARPKPPGPATFAEMGFQGAKAAEDKDCVIM